MPYPRKHKNSKSSGTGTNSSGTMSDMANPDWDEIEIPVGTPPTPSGNHIRTYVKDLPPDYSNGLPVPKWITENGLSPTPPPGYQVKPWLPAAHCCPCCKTPTSDNQYRISCLYKHQVPCDGFHNTMMRPNKHNACSACNIELLTTAADEKRIAEADRKATEEVASNYSSKRGSLNSKVTKTLSTASKLKRLREEKHQNTLLRRLDRY